MKARGRWAWWNQYGPVSLNRCAQRAREARLDGVIVKWGYPDVRRRFEAEGLAWATERYVYPSQPEVEAHRLVADVREGAAFAVINAEVEWESLPAGPMVRLINEFRRLEPNTELYACVDTRGGRSALPYQDQLGGVVAGWMPMVYPGAFEQSVGAAFAAALDHADFRGKPVLPVVQTYGGHGAGFVRAQLAEVKRRRLSGVSAYTIAHATDAEWRVWVEEGRDMQGTTEQRATVYALFAECQAYAAMGKALPRELRERVEYLLALAAA